MSNYSSTINDDNKELKNLTDITTIYNENDDDKDDNVTDNRGNIGDFFKKIIKKVSVFITDILT